MRGYSLYWGLEKAFLKDEKETAREVGAECGEEGSREREPLIQDLRKNEKSPKQGWRR